jgi:hypothetical protein
MSAVAINTFSDSVVFELDLASSAIFWDIGAPP